MYHEELIDGSLGNLPAVRSFDKADLRGFLASTYKRDGGIKFDITIESS
jgi:hypothetical protein